VPSFRGWYEPSRVLWVEWLPTNTSRTAFINIWSRPGCVVDVRTCTYVIAAKSIAYSREALNGFAHVELASIEEASRTVRQGVQHGFRYKGRLLDIDFSPWVLYIGPCGVHLQVACVEWPAWTTAMDVRYPQYRRGNNSYVPTTSLYPKLSTLSLRLTSCQMINNSASISERMVLKV
jgi:hypothetical protein